MVSNFVCFGGVFCFVIAMRGANENGAPPLASGCLSVSIDVLLQSMRHGNENNKHTSASQS